LGAPLDVDAQLALVEELGEALQSTSLEPLGRLMRPLDRGDSIA
jgi:hypothetical protein